MATSPRATRVLKTAWFAKAARKAAIADDELCRAVKQARELEEICYGDQA